MTGQEIRAQLIEVLQSVVPGFEADRLEPDRPLRDQIDLDSMDWINVIAAVQERLHVDIPEADFGKLTTLEAVVAYLGAKRAG